MKKRVISVLVVLFLLLGIISYFNKKESIKEEEGIKAEKELDIVYEVAVEAIHDCSDEKNMDKVEEKIVNEPANDQDESLPDGVVYVEDFEVRSVVYRYFEEQVPEMEIIEKYISKKSGGEAEMYANYGDICEVYDENNSSKLLGRYYPIYVGEQWADGRKIPWDYFYVREDAADILCQNVALLDMESIEEWRSSESYKKRMEGMASYLENN